MGNSWKKDTCHIIIMSDLYLYLYIIFILYNFPAFLYSVTHESTSFVIFVYFHLYPFRFLYLTCLIYLMHTHKERYFCFCFVVLLNQLLKSITYNCCYAIINLQNRCYPIDFQTCSLDYSTSFSINKYIYISIFYV